MPKDDLKIGHAQGVVNMLNNSLEVDTAALSAFFSASTACSKKLLLSGQITALFLLSAAIGAEIVADWSNGEIVRFRLADQARVSDAGDSAADAPPPIPVVDIPPGGETLPPGVEAKPYPQNGHVSEDFTRGDSY